MLVGKTTLPLSEAFTNVVNLHAKRGRAGRALLSTLLFLLGASQIGATSAPAVESASFIARELVDVEYLADHTLAILISSPGAAQPGLYLWKARDRQPRKLCGIGSVAVFSFDRRSIIERERGLPSRIRVYSPSDCALTAAIEIPGRVLDVDVWGRYIAAAVRLADQSLELQLYRANGELVSSTAIGRNVEMGFSPDGRFLVNFDLSDAGLQAWRLPRMRANPLPDWLIGGDTTFLPGSRYLKRYADGKLSLMRWPLGTVAHAISASRSLRLRALTSDARFGLAHEFEGTTEALQWIDFVRDRRSVLARGSIDNAAIARDVSQAAWSLRLPGRENRVVVQRRTLAGAIANMPVADFSPAEPFLPLNDGAELEEPAKPSDGGRTSLLPRLPASAPRTLP